MIAAALQPVATPLRTSLQDEMRRARKVHSQAHDLVRTVMQDVRLGRAVHMDGVEATRRIAGGNEPPKVVVLTSFSDRDRIRDALDAGAIGYLLKDAEPDDLLRGVRAAARGDWPLDPRAVRLLLGETDGRPSGPRLSDRERQVLALVVEGLPNKSIARKLGISERTVKAHLTRIFEQLGVADRTQAALWAQRHGLVTP